MAPDAPWCERCLALDDQLDPISAACLGELGVPEPGTRALELGPGRGSILALLSRHVGAEGQVVAIDRDVRQLPVLSNVEAIEYDLRRGLPVTGPFSLIHARLVLGRLPNRHGLVAQSAAALGPGGWLVIGEFDYAEPPVIIGAGPAELFGNVIHASMSVLAAQDTMDFAWLSRAREAIRLSGLIRTRLHIHRLVCRGGDPGCAMIAACVRQQHQQLLGTGLAQRDLQSFYDLLENPQVTVRLWPFACLMGQKPVISQTIWVP